MKTDPSVSIIFPPLLVAPGGPPLAPALICAYLQAQGKTARTADLNLHFNRWLTKPGGHLHKYLEFKIGQLKELKHKPELTSMEVSQLRGHLSTLALLPEEFLTKALSEDGADIKTLDCEQIDNLTALLIRFGSEAQLFALPEYQGIFEKVSTKFNWIFDDYYGSEEFSAKLKEISKSEIVGISLSWAHQLPHVLLLAEKLKAINSEIRIVVGGPIISLLFDEDREKLVSHPTIDAMVLYEGEKPLAQLAEVYEKGGNLDSVEGIAFRDGSGKIHTTGLGEPMDPNESLTPSFEKEDLPLYFRKGITPSPNAGDHLPLPVLATRGCYWNKCSFCERGKLRHPKQKGYQARDPEKVVDDIQALQARHGVFHFVLTTESLPPAWTRRFADELIKRRVYAKHWAFCRNEGRRVFSGELLRKMKKAGIEYLTCGAESVSDRILKVIKKGTTVEELFDSFYMFAIAGIDAQFNYIPDYPGTEVEDVIKGMNCLMDRRDVITDLNPQPFDFTVRSEVGEKPEEYGLEAKGGMETYNLSRRYGSIEYKRVSGITDNERMGLLVPFLTMYDQLVSYQQTVRNRERLDTAGFDWNKAVFAFWKFVEIPFPFSIKQNGATEDVIFMIPEEGPQRLLEIPQSMTNMIRVIRDNAYAPVSFEAIVSAYVADLEALQENTTPLQIVEDCKKFVRELVYEGLISHVFGGPCFEPNEIIKKATKKQDQAQDGPLRVINTGIAADPTKFLALNPLLNKKR